MLFEIDFIGKSGTTTVFRGLLSRALFVNYSVKRGLATFRTINSNYAVSSGRKGACPHPGKNTFLMRGLVILSSVNHNMVFNRMKPVIICPSYSALRQAAGASLMTHLRFSDLFFIVLIMILASILAVPVLAQDTESGTIRQERATSGADEGEEETVEVDISEDTTPIGIVDLITLTGDIVTSRSAVLNQLTFKVGDEISERDITLSKQRLLSLNGIYWMADFTREPAEVEGHINITIDLAARRTWYLSPSQIGGVVGDRNFLGSADTVYLGIYMAEDDHFFTAGWIDPQFLGGHNTLSVTGSSLDTSHTIRTDTIFSTGESYLVDRTFFDLSYRTRWLNEYGVAVGYKLDQVETEKFGDPFGSFGTDDHFFYSGRDIPDGTVGTFNFQLSGGYLNSRYFPTDGYYWNTYSEFSGEYSMSDFDFTRHTVTAAYFKDIYANENVLCGRVMYSYLTGSPPDYEMLPFDWQVRGYTGGTHRGKSLFAANFEYRFIAEPDIFQGVLFADFGRSWDDHSFSFDDLEWGVGGGIRLYTQEFIPYNLLLRIDYGFSASGEEAIIGFNQFF